MSSSQEDLSKMSVKVLVIYINIYIKKKKLFGFIPLLNIKC